MIEQKPYALNSLSLCKNCLFFTVVVLGKLEFFSGKIQTQLSSEAEEGMLGKLLASPVLTFDSTQCRSFSAVTPNIQRIRGKAWISVTRNIQRIRGKAWISVCTSKKWEVQSIATQTTLLGDEESKMWEACRQALSAFKLSDEEEDKILGKAFGQLHSPYWGEERTKEVPKVEVVNEILDYLRGLGLSDEDLFKLLKKFPEVLGCSLDNELRYNVQILEKEWGIKGKTLRNLLLRNPKVLGYNVDCKGDCMAKCTRCWVRF